MTFGTQRESAALDRHITGNHGEDSTDDSPYVGEAQHTETTYECQSCLNTFTVTVEPDSKTGEFPEVPATFFHEECPDDPSWQE